jgi:hypothetical protein
MLRFSGHDTFHCKEQWLLKGYQKVDIQGYRSSFSDSSALVDLGVGKNMVRAIAHWMKAFHLIDEENNLTSFSNDVFSENGYDPYLENQGTLWLLQYKLCSTEYASLYKMVFSDYFLDKATLEFSESQVISYVNRKMVELGEKVLTSTTVASDLKVLLKTFITPKRNEKTLEDDFNAPLQSLKLINVLERVSESKDKIYQINRKDKQRDLSVEVFGCCLLSEFEHTDVLSFDVIKGTAGAYLCLTNDGLIEIIERLSEQYPVFVFKEDAGVRQLQVKVADKVGFRDQLLKAHYEN